MPQSPPPGPVTGHLPSERLLKALAPLAPVPDRPDLVAHQAPDVFALWQAWEQESGSRQDVPFWGVVWPAARMLAGFLERNPEWVRGRNVVDLGCGGGVAAIAAAKAGARRVCANDIDPVALEMTARNAAANDVLLRLDGADLIERGWPEDTGVILVSDLFYERAMSTALEERLRRSLREGLSVLVADSSRPFAPRTGIRLLAEERFPTDWDLEGRDSRLVRLFTMLPGA
jgi:predicted nicotinamide N-methyase